jgi:hypothetical protein
VSAVARSREHSVAARDEPRRRRAQLDATHGTRLGQGIVDGGTGHAGHGVNERRQPQAPFSERVSASGIGSLGVFRHPADRR